jgi:hypothetical protein
MFPPHNTPTVSAQTMEARKVYRFRTASRTTLPKFLIVGVSVLRLRWRVKCERPILGAGRKGAF